MIFDVMEKNAILLLILQLLLINIFLNCASKKDKNKGNKGKNKNKRKEEESGDETQEEEEEETETSSERRRRKRKERKKKKGSKSKSKSKSHSKEATGTPEKKVELTPFANPQAPPPEPKAPAVGGVIAETYDPNYQTLAGLNNDQVFGKAAGPEVPPAPKAPAVGGAKAGTYDPNYQTLAGLNNAEIFKEKKPAAPVFPTAAAVAAPAGNPNGKPKAPENRAAKAATFDPNYQTLAGLNNADIFKK